LAGNTSLSASAKARKSAIKLRPIREESFERERENEHPNAHSTFRDFNPQSVLLDEHDGVKSEEEEDLFQWEEEKTLVAALMQNEYV